jgi:3-methylfumaryl-CoA hydratase
MGTILEFIYEVKNLLMKFNRGFPSTFKEFLNYKISNECFHLCMNHSDQNLFMLATPPETTVRKETCGIAAVRRVAAMLDLDPDDVVDGAPLPRGWQFILMGADTRRSVLRADGFPGFGVPMPDLSLPRLVLGSRSVEYRMDIPIGACVTRHSSIQSLTQKTSKSGAMVVATIAHALRLGDAATPALVETQTYLLLPAFQGTSAAGVSSLSGEVTGDHVKTVMPDETLLFQYSALGFNSHKIHIDRAHARNVEGFPDLVVNGGLATLLLTEFLRHEIGVSPASFKARHVAPLFCGNPITLVANQTGAQWRLQAYDNRSTLAVDMEVQT